MSNVPVYVICDKNCKFEGMTKEQILTAIAQAVETGEIGDINTGFVQTIKTVNGVGLKFFVGTQNAYDALSDSDKENLFALITDDTSSAELLEYLNGLSDRVTVLENKAAASHATTADRATYATSAGTADTATSATKANKIASLGAAADNVARCVWFSDSDEKELPRRDDDFKYNPYTNTLTVKNVSGNASTATNDVNGHKLTSLVAVSDTIDHPQQGEVYLLGTLPVGKTISDVIGVVLNDGYNINGSSGAVFAINDSQKAHFEVICPRHVSSFESLDMSLVKMDVWINNEEKVAISFGSVVTATLEDDKVSVYLYKDYEDISMSLKVTVYFK